MKLALHTHDKLLTKQYLQSPKNVNKSLCDRSVAESQSMTVRSDISMGWTTVNVGTTVVWMLERLHVLIAVSGQ